MRRVMIIGGPGNGKSTLARRLGARLNLPVYHLDQLYWSPGWVERDHAQVHPEVARIVADPDWIIDGNFTDSWSLRAARADTIILLDLPMPLRLWRVLRRIVREYGSVRSDMAPGCPERLDWAFLKWTVCHGWQHAPHLRTLARDHAAHLDMRHFTSCRALRDFMAELG